MEAQREENTPRTPNLDVLDPTQAHAFLVPVKKINDNPDVSTFLISKAYTDIMKFVLQLNAAMFPVSLPASDSEPGRTQAWELDAADVSFSHTVTCLRSLLQALDQILDEVPPDTGPRRFGNASFRKWTQMVEERITDLLETHLPASILSRETATDVTAISELKSYLLGSLGSAQRLDYGTGHELNFLAFLGCIWKLGGFDASTSGAEERGIVFGVIEP